MRIFLYEWATGGGLIEHHGALPETLLREGLAMAQALAADAAAIAGCRPVLMRDPRVEALVVPGAELVEVNSRFEHHEAFQRLAADSDAVLLVAPETDGVLLRLAGLAESLGAALLSPSAEFVATAGDKEQTASRLRASTVPTPESRRLEPDELLPEDFPYPAVVKPIDGAGSQDTYLVASAHDRPPAYAWPRRIERLAPGAPVSVAMLCGEGGLVRVLPPCRQRISADGRFAYLGGSTPLAPGLSGRAASLARRVAEALPTARGYVGVDMVLGDSPSGEKDYVIEVNPRLTTSYVALRAAARSNLLQAMRSAALGESIELEFDPRPIGFDSDGAVYYE